MLWPSPSNPSSAEKTLSDPMLKRPLPPNAWIDFRRRRFFLFFLRRFLGMSDGFGVLVVVGSGAVGVVSAAFSVGIHQPRVIVVVGVLGSAVVVEVVGVRGVDPIVGIHQPLVIWVEVVVGSVVVVVGAFVVVVVVDAVVVSSVGIHQPRVVCEVVVGGLVVVVASVGIHQPLVDVVAAGSGRAVVVVFLSVLENICSICSKIGFFFFLLFLFFFHFDVLSASGLGQTLFVSLKGLSRGGDGGFLLFFFFSFSDTFCMSEVSNSRVRRLLVGAGTGRAGLRLGGDVVVVVAGSFGGLVVGALGRITTAFSPLPLG